MGPEPTASALAPTPLARHPGGDESLRLADDAGSRALELRRRDDASVERSRNLRRLPREPLFVVPLLQAFAYFLGLF